jgi:ABC-type bacteriocin/lantibiotic exporter with double-glycine peptidase domain
MITSILNKKTNFIVDIAIAKTVYHKIQKLPIRDLESGEKVNIINRALYIRSTHGTNIASIFLSFITQLLTIIILFFNFGWISIVFLSFSIIFSLILLFKEDKLNERKYFFNLKNEEERRRINAIFNLLSDKCNSLELYAYKTREQYTNKLKHFKESLYKKEMKESIYNTFMSSCNDALTDICFIILCIVTAVFLLFEKITVSIAISAVTIGIGQIHDATSQCIYLISQIRNQRYALNEFEQFLSLEENNHNYLEKEKNPLLESIIFDKVSYFYRNSDNLILDSISLRIKNGEKVAIIGENGAGKSTLIRLLLGLDKPTHGNIKYNNSELNYNSYIWASSSVMLQNFYRYPYNVMNNITFTDCLCKTDKEHFDKTVSWTQVDKIAAKLPDLYETEIIDGGYFSGGEWQKIALSRAKYKSAQLYVLDEPNAAVDPKYELEIMNDFFQLIGNNAAVIISHRLPICQLCDKIIVMRKGRIIELGSHMDLLKIKNGVYKSMFHSQAELYI